MTHHNMILALIQHFSVGHITVTEPCQTSHGLNEYVSIMMQCLVISRLCRLCDELKNLSYTLKTKRRSYYINNTIHLNFNSEQKSTISTLHVAIDLNKYLLRIYASTLVLAYSLYAASENAPWCFHIVTATPWHQSNDSSQEYLMSSSPTHRNLG